MKVSSIKSLLILMLFTVFTISSTYSQENRKSYTSTSLEMIFSFADIQVEGVNTKNILRWAPVLNIQYIYNYDAKDNFGVFTGIDMKNLGFIWENEQGEKWKHRVYALGVPVGFKFGNLNSGMFLYGGAELEYAFNYKQKYFLNGTKEEKDVYWFTDRVNIFQGSLMLGVNFPHGFNIKFKYYLTDLMNQDYEAYDENGDKYKPYESMTSSQVFFISLSFNMFHRDYEYFHKE